MMLKLNQWEDSEITLSFRLSIIVKNAALTVITLINLCNFHTYLYTHKKTIKHGVILSKKRS